MSLSGLVSGATFKIALPWLMNALGLSKMLRERWIHCPEAHLGDAVDAANVVLQTSAPGSVLLTPRMWRAVESVQASILNEGIIAKVTPR